MPRALWLAIPMAVAAVGVLSRPIEPADSWFHAALGRRILESGTVDGADDVAWSRQPAAYRYQSWLSGVLFALALALGGPALLAALPAVALVGAVALADAALVRRCRDPALRSILLTLAALLAIPNAGVRPQTLCYPLLAAFLWAGGERRRARWLLPLLMVVWTNLHGSFVLGLALVAFEAVGRRLERRALGWALATLAASCLHPAGAGVALYVVGVVSHPAVVGGMEEWLPATVGDPYGQVFHAYAIGVAVVLVAARRPVRPAEALILVAFLWLALSMRRAISWFALASLPPVAAAAAAALGSSGDRAPGRWRAPAVALAVLLVAAVVVASPWVRPALGLGPVAHRSTPVEAVRAVRADPERPGRLFHSMEYGSYLLWAAPEIAVFADPRIEHYPAEVWADHQAVLAGDLGPLDARQADGLLVPVDSPAAAAARRSASWTLRHEDDRAAYFGRPRGWKRTR